LWRSQLAGHVGPVVASTDYMKAYAEQIRPFVPKGRTYKVLGTDGFGRSDFRSKLREHFEVNRHYIVVAALKALSEDGTVPAALVARSHRAIRHRCRQGQPAVRLRAARDRRAPQSGDNKMALIDIQVPDIGDFDQVTVIELLVKPGDAVKAEQSLITVESDKASMEIPSSQAGVVKELRVALGDKVAQGSVVLVLEVTGDRQLHLLWVLPCQKASPLPPWQALRPCLCTYLTSVTSKTWPSSRCL
jgi:biotin carboxyl carrier protein